MIFLFILIVVNFGQPPSGGGGRGPPPGDSSGGATGGTGGTVDYGSGGTNADGSTFTASGPTAASTLGTCGLTTVSIEAESTVTFGTGTSPGEDIYGPFEAGFNSQQDFILERFGCDPPSLGYLDGGLDTELATQIVNHNCDPEPPIEHLDLDECGGHTQEYHLHELLTCLYDEDASGHSTEVGEGNDGQKIYGKYEDTDEEPLLDACGGHYGQVPNQEGVVYHYHVQDPAPFTFGCFGPNSDGSLVTVEQCRALYDTCGDGLNTYQTNAGDVQYDNYCPCYDANGSNTGIDIVPLPVFTQNTNTDDGGKPGDGGDFDWNDFDFGDTAGSGLEGFTQVTTTWQNIERIYYTYTPTSGGDAGVVVFLHGSGMDQGIGAANQYDALSIADTYGATAIVPVGTSNTESGFGYEWQIDGQPGADEVGFIQSIVNDVSSGMAQDAYKIAIGFSNGAGLASLLTCVDFSNDLFVAHVAGFIQDNADQPSTCQTNPAPGPIWTAIGADDYFLASIGIDGLMTQFQTLGSNNCPAVDYTTTSTTEYSCYEYDCDAMDLGMCVYNGLGHDTLPSMATNAMDFLVSGERDGTEVRFIA